MGYAVAINARTAASAESFPLSTAHIVRTALQCKCKLHDASAGEERPVPIE
jgi:hypothetical protein